ncbi:MAG: hypothetical protein IKQ24_03190, partial [Verrucomicrobia bacterium]|nr:hypothetical protein [Verrucomicrobiota bacterium]
CSRDNLSCQFSLFSSLYPFFCVLSTTFGRFKTNAAIGEDHLAGISSVWLGCGGVWWNMVPVVRHGYYKNFDYYNSPVESDK